MKIKCINIQKINGDALVPEIKLHDLSQPIPDGWREYTLDRIIKERDDAIKRAQGYVAEEKNNEVISLLMNNLVNIEKQLKDAVVRKYESAMNGFGRLVFEFTQEEIDELNEGK